MREQASNATGSNDPKNEKNKKPVPKAAIISILAAALLLFVLVGTYFVLDSIYKPEKVVTAFSEAVQTENYEQLEKVLQVDKRAVSFTKSDLEGYVYVSLNGKYVTIYSNLDDAILYVNGKSTGEKVSDIDEFGHVKNSSLLRSILIRKGTPTMNQRNILII